MKHAVALAVGVLGFGGAIGSRAASVMGTPYVPDSWPVCAAGESRLDPRFQLVLTDVEKLCTGVAGRPPRLSQGHSAAGAIDVQVMLRGRGEPVCSPNRGPDTSGPMQITVLSLNIHRRDEDPLWVSLGRPPRIPLTVGQWEEVR